MNQLDLTKTLDNITDTLSSVSNSVSNLDKSLVSHMAAEEIITRNLVNTLNEARADIKALASHQDAVAQDMQEHIENRVTNCNHDIMMRLNNDFMDKNEIKLLAAEIIEKQTKIRRDEITKAVISSENRMESRIEQKLSELKANIIAKEDKYIFSARLIWFLIVGGITVITSITLFLIKHSGTISNILGVKNG